MSRLRLLKTLPRCEDCLGSGKSLPHGPPWDKFPGSACEACAGLGVTSAVRAKTLLVGDIFQDVTGRRWVLMRKGDDWLTVCSQDDANAQPEIFRREAAVKLLLRPDVCINIDPSAGR